MGGLLKHSAMIRATTWQASLLCTGMTYYYVHILRSITYPDRYYAGFTKEIDARVKEHNNGKCVHTSKYIPWGIKTAVAFTNRKKAIEFEKYLKTSSGSCFAPRKNDRGEAYFFSPLKRKLFDC
jgi:predicted GIY-YIG superfamily endonuclease